MGKVIAFKELTFYKGDYSQSSGLTESTLGGALRKCHGVRGGRVTGLWWEGIRGLNEGGDL